MTTQHVSLDAVIGMLRRAERFGELPAGQQAALRAQVTRSLRATQDADIAAVLSQIQDVIGVAAPAPADRMTAADLLAEYDAAYARYSVRQRAAFKAKVSRLGNTAAGAGDAETAAVMSELSARIAAEEEAGQRDLIRRLAEQLGQ